MDTNANIEAARARQRLLFGISPEEQQRQVERERAKDDAHARTLSRFRDYAEKNNLPELEDRVAELRRTPRAQPAAPVTDDVSPAAAATGGVPTDTVAPPAPAAPEQPPAPEAPAEPETLPEQSAADPEPPVNPEPATSQPETDPAADEAAPEDTSADAAPTADSLVDGPGTPAADESGDGAPTNDSPDGA